MAYQITCGTTVLSFKKDKFAWESGGANATGGVATCGARFYIPDHIKGDLRRRGKKGFLIKKFKLWHNSGVDKTAYIRYLPFGKPVWNHGITTDSNSYGPLCNGSVSTAAAKYKAASFVPIDEDFATGVNHYIEFFENFLIDFDDLIEATLESMADAKFTSLTIVGEIV
jgi:hypothetical protein